MQEQLASYGGELTLFKAGGVLMVKQQLGRGTSIVDRRDGQIVSFHALTGQLNHKREEHQGERCIRD